MTHYPSFSSPDVSTDFVRIIDPGNVGIRQGSTTVVVSWRDIIHVRAERKRTWFATTSGPLKSSGTLVDVVDTLSPLGLVRVHRGLAINSSRVRRLVGRGRHRLILTLDTGDEFLVGRQFQRLVRSRFGCGENRSPQKRRGGPFNV